jgi:agmatine deiminase
MSATQLRMPAEWEPHAATLLAWPHDKSDWPGKFAPIPWVYAEIIRYLAQAERVRLLVADERERQLSEDVCGRAGVDLGKVNFYAIPTNRVWLRDSGPIFVKPSSLSSSGLTRGSIKTGNTKRIDPRVRPEDDNDGLAMLDFRFNAWAKYPNHRLDDKVPEKLNGHVKRERIQPMHNGRRVVLEGGSIDVNGKGTLLTTEECLLSEVQQRNPGFTREDYEAVFREYLGITHTVWLGSGITGDDTHGHVDDLSRFVSADTVVTLVERVE